LSKRKILCIFLTFFILFSSIPFSSVSADSIGKEATACRELGILIGSDATGITSKYLATTPNRAQALIIFLRLKGLYMSAGSEAFDTNFKDSNTLDWAKAYLGYAKNNPHLGWVGQPDGNFAPSNKINGKSFYKTMLETLGYKQNIDFEYANTLVKAQQLKIIQSAAAIDQLTNFTINDVAIAIYNALNTEIKGSGKKLIDQMIEENTVTAESALKAGFKIATTPVGVKSFKVVNNNKLQIEFEQNIVINKNDIEIINEKDHSKLNVTSVSSNNNITDITTSDAIAFNKYNLKINTLIPTNNLAVKDYETTYVAPSKDVTKPTATVEVTDSNELIVTYSEEVDKTTAENSSNYVIQNDLPILQAKLDTTGKKVILTTEKSQTDGYLYWITVQNVTDVSGNRMDTYEYKFAGIPRDTSKPYIVSLISESNKTISIVFSKKVNEVTAENSANYSIDKIAVTDARLQEDGKTVKLTTTEQSASVLYKITVQNISDKYGVYMDRHERRITGSAGDSTKPRATALVIASNEIMIRYSEKIDRTAAEDSSNYSIDKGLEVLKAVLDDSGKIVNLLTSKQTSGTLYTIGISGIPDLFGNMIDYYTSQFGGMSENATPLNFTASSSTNAVIITFNKRVEKTSAENTSNYLFDNNLGSPTKATLDSTGKIVTLQTAGQISGKLYSIDIRNLTDSFGIEISTDDAISKKFFMGTGNTSERIASLKTIVTIDSCTIDLVFDTDLTEEELTAMSVIIATENDKYFSPPAGLQYKKFFVDGKSTVRVQFKTTASTIPVLFTSGKVYELKIGDFDRLQTDAKVSAFAGTSKTKQAPRIQDANPINSTALEVTFSEPVTGLTTSSFSISGVTIDKISAEQNDVVSTVTLYFRTSLIEGKQYTLTPRSTIKDGAGYNSIQMKNDSDYTYYKDFYGIDIANEAPQLVEVTPVNRHMINVTFSEPVSNGDTASYTIRKISGSGSSTSFIISKKIANNDKTQISLYLNANNSGLSDGSVYELSSSAVTDYQGKTLNTNYRKLEFAGISGNAPALEIIASSINIENKIVTLSFSKEIDVSEPSINWFALTGAGYYPSSNDKITLSENKRIISIELKNQLQSNDKLTIEISDTGKAEMIDYNRLKISTEELTINTN